MLEKRLKERTGAVVKERLALTDAQMTRLQSTNRQFESQRSQLITRERDVRRELRKQIQSGDAANQARVGQLLDQAMQLERQRLELQQNEQRELAKFLTPVQRAKLFGLQNELRRRAQDMRDRPLREQRKLQSRKARNFN
jgi:Spy/CpxP family protein refolding chaperone